jgi:hypothetical protein
MDLTASIDTKKFENAIMDLAIHSGKKVADVLEQTAALVVRDAVRFTPPFSKAPTTESFRVKKKVGMRAVASDINAIFKYPWQSRALSASEQIREHKANKLTLSRVLNRMGIPNVGVVSTLKEMELHHKRYRNKRGRVYFRKNKGHIFVLKEGLIEKYIKHVQKRVGQAMSGWKWGVQKLGSKGVPKWAQKAFPKSAGSVKVNKKGGRFPDWSAVVSNNVPYINYVGATARPIQRAFDNQQRNLEKRIVQAIKHGARKARLKAK